MYQGKLYGLPCIIGGTVIYYNKDLLAKAGVTKIPTTEAELAAAAAEGAGARRRRLGPQRPALEQGLHVVLPLPRHPQPRRRHHLEGPVEGDLQPRRSRRPRCSSTSDLVNKWKVQPPVGQYDREAGVVAVQGRPDRLPPRRAAPAVASSAARSSRSSGTSSTRSAPAGSARSSRPPATGSWPRRARTRTRPGSS